MPSKPQPSKNKRPNKDLRIKQLIRERSALNESLNKLLEKINNKGSKE